jgi:hypothetical protein
MFRRISSLWEEREFNRRFEWATKRHSELVHRLDAGQITPAEFRREQDGIAHFLSLAGERLQRSR